MRKFLKWTSVILLLLVLAAPALLGQILARALPEAVENYARDQGLVVHSAQFDAGWFTTDIVIALGDEQRALDAQLTARHLLPPGQLISTEGTVRAPLPASLEATINYTLDVAVILHPTDGAGRSTLNATHRGGQISLAFQDFSLPAYQLTGLTGELQWRRQQADDFTLAGTLNVDHWSLDQGGGDSLGLTLDARRQGNNLALDVLATAAAGRWMDRELTDANLDLALRDLHAPTLEHLVAALEAAEDAVDPELARAQAVGTALGPLILNRPQLERGHLRFGSQVGPADATFDARFLRAPSTAFIQQPSVLMRVLEINGRAQLSEGIARVYARRQAAQRYLLPADPETLRLIEDEVLTNLVNNGVLVPQDGGFGVDFEYIPGRVNLNGQSMSLPDDFFDTF